MASFSDHLEQAQHNWAILYKLLNSNGADSTDWEITICYYTALHLIKAQMGGRANSHYELKQQLKKAIPRNIYAYYSELEQLSRYARYLEVGKTKVSVGQDEYRTALTLTDKIIDWFCSKHKTTDWEALEVDAPIQGKYINTGMSFQRGSSPEQQLD